MISVGKRFAIIPVLAMFISLFGIPASAAGSGDAEAAVPTEYVLCMDDRAETSLWVYEVGGCAYFKLRDIAAVLNGTEKQFDISWEPEYREVDLIQDCAYAPAGGELSEPENTGNAVAQLTDCSIRCGNDWGNILAYLIDGSHYVKLSDLAAVIGIFSEYDIKTRTAVIDTLPEAVFTSYSGEIIDNIALMNAGNAYSLGDDGTLVIRFANGTKAEAPLTLESAAGSSDYSQSIDAAGFYISESKTAVSYCDDDGAVRILSSGDMGKTWETSEVIARNVGTSQMYLGFSTENDGWLVVCQFHGMGSESHYIYRTSDGGKTWTQTGNPNDLYARVLTGAGFADGNTGFLCYRFETDFSPAICRTTDGGLTWEKVSVEVPEEFDAYYSRTALSPVFSGANGVLPVELMNSDGETILIYFTSDDYGDTWTYSPS